MDIASKFVGAHPPDFTRRDAEKIAEEFFGIKGHLEPLWGERDQNFALRSSDGAGFVLKISNDREDWETLDFQMGALRWLAQHAPDVPVPRIVAARNGEVTAQVTGPEGARHFVHMITLLEGCRLAQSADDFDAYGAAGALAGAAAKGLRGYFHKAAGSKLFWDMRHIGDFSGCLSGIGDAGLRGAVADFIPFFYSDILPKLGFLRAQVIHHDANSANLLVDSANPKRMTGLIDFGDLIHGTVAQDIAVAAIELQWKEAKIARNTSSILRNIVSAISGYDSVMPLEEAEVDLLYDLMTARCALGILIGVARRHHDISSAADAEYAAIYGPLLEALLTCGRDKVRATIRDTCRFPVHCPAAPLPAGTNRAATEDLMTRRHAALGKALSLTYDRPFHALRGRGVWLYDVDGRRHLDCYNNVPHVGHCHPHVVKALSRQASALNTNTRYLYESVVAYAERLAALMPGDLGACLFVNSGSEATDVALRMARTCTGRNGALVMEGAYHGITSEIHALSPSCDWGMEGVHVSRTRPDIELLINPDTLRGPYRADEPQVADKYAKDADRALAKLRAAGYPAGAFMVDSAFSTSGILEVPEGYLKGVVDRIRADGGMIIADEVQYGFGRSGSHFWGFQNHGITPDIVTLGKPIGNGLALGVVVTTPEILERFTGSTDFFSTFGGNPVACAAGMAVLDVIEKEKLQQNARETGAYLIEGLREVARDSDRLGDVRGQGLFAGVDVVTDKNTLTPDAAECARIKNHLRNGAVLVGSEGIDGNLLKIRPPMVFRREHADLLIEGLRSALT